ncbi:hypothetical protein C5167_006318 [Papaver somniferum]|uniref:Uncharacterized protein n=1 Tax=Papaver somniferum TaxID=3469 RepID=A0A4Y7JH98_PAPSO|nr:hypothetical protein C5167_006318 [Papaver somniferum]
MDLIILINYGSLSVAGFTQAMICFKSREKYFETKLKSLPDVTVFTQYLADLGFCKMLLTLLLNLISTPIHGRVREGPELSVSNINQVHLHFL